MSTEGCGINYELLKRKAEVAIPCVMLKKWGLQGNKRLAFYTEKCGVGQGGGRFRAGILPWGSDYKVCADWTPAKGATSWNPSTWLLNPFKIGEWHNVDLVLSQIDPRTRTKEGPKAVVGKVQTEQ